MKAARGVLAATAAVFGVLGVGFLLWPAVLVGAVGVELPVPAARTEIRALYGGWQIGFAGFLAGCVRNHVSAGLRAGCWSLGAIAVARAFGMGVDGEASRVVLLLFASESAGALACGWALARCRGGGRPDDGFEQPRREGRR